MRDRLEKNETAQFTDRYYQNCIGVYAENPQQSGYHRRRIGDVVCHIGKADRCTACYRAIWPNPTNPIHRLGNENFHGELSTDRKEEAGGASVNCGLPNSAMRNPTASQNSKYARSLSRLLPLGWQIPPLWRSNPPPSPGPTRVSPEGRGDPEIPFYREVTGSKKWDGG